MATSDEGSTTLDPPTWRRLTSSASSDVVYQTDRDGVVTWISDDVEQLLGWPPSEVVGTHARDLMHDADLERIDQVQAAVLSGTAQNDVTCRFRTSAGAYRGCSLRARPLVDVGESVIGSIVVMRDVHDSAAAARALVTLSRGNRVLVRARDEQELLRDMCRTYDADVVAAFDRVIDAGFAFLPAP